MNRNFKKRFTQHGEYTVITNKKYVHENAIAEVLRVVPLYCMDVKVGLSVKEWNHIIASRENVVLTANVAYTVAWTD